MTAPATDTTSTTDTTAADAAVAASTEATKETPASEIPAATPKTTLTGEPAKADTPDSAPAAPTPVTYDLKLPENAAIDASTIERTTAFARESGLSNEVAQKSLEFLNSEISKRESEYLESTRPGGAAWTERVTEFEAKALKDPAIGGSPEKLKASAQEAQRVLKQYDPQGELGAFLHETGFGSSPVVLKFLSAIAKATSDGTILPGDSTGTGKDKGPASLYDHPTSIEASKKP